MHRLRVARGRHVDWQGARSAACLAPELRIDARSDACHSLSVLGNDWRRWHGRERPRRRRRALECPPGQSSGRNTGSEPAMMRWEWQHQTDVLCEGIARR